MITPTFSLWRPILRLENPPAHLRACLLRVLPGRERETRQTRSETRGGENNRGSVCTKVVSSDTKLPLTSCRVFYSDAKIERGIQWLLPFFLFSPSPFLWLLLFVNSSLCHLKTNGSCCVGWGGCFSCPFCKQAYPRPSTHTLNTGLVLK